MMRLHPSGFLIAAWLSLVTGLLVPVRAQQAAAAAACRVVGRAVSGTTVLPGVAVVARLNDAVTAATSTESDGTYSLALPPGAYRLIAELPGFAAYEQSVS